jgi:hypothetical protein
MCPETLEPCDGWLPADGRTFGPERSPTPLAPDDAGRVARAARTSLHAGIPVRSQRIELVADRRQRLIPMQEPQLVFGGHNLSAPRGSRVDVDVSMELRGEPGSVVVSQGLDTARDKRPHSHKKRLLYARRHQELRTGDTLTLRYSAVLEDDVARMSSYLAVQDISRPGLELDIHEARMEIHPPALGNRPGVTVREARITHDAAAP